MTTKVNPDVVEINRFYRPKEFNFDPQPGQGDFTIFSERGVTVMFTLNYAKEIFTARYSVCNGDNFSRVNGIMFAQACSRLITGQLERDKSLYDMLLDEVFFILNSGLDSDLPNYVRDLTRLRDELLECK